ncbi:LacI family DNA-binding transcriptional regulator [Streptobacillus canis]|uniref:LacI family DNA-binding transcriptional regulator n=1 Tax=Streptobacillus canis TaxID=2678686 RepID=UPI0012E26EF0|nr:LacI family DNA-binding transcriptional regulator [Streptobacillus canis]
MLRKCEIMKEKVTIKTIAKIAGVSAKTVSKVINNQSGVKNSTRIKILEIMKSNNYSINYNAKRLSESKSRNIALIANISRKHPLNKNYIIMQHILENIVDYDVIVYNSVADLQENPYGGIAKSYYDGIILLNPRDIEDIEYVKKSELPFVISGIYGNYSYVGTDQFQSGIIATEHLINLGCSDIVFLLDNKESLTAKKKIQGFKKALELYNIKDKKQSILDGYSTPESVEKYIIEIYKKKKLPEAILIDSDYPVFGALRAFQKLGIKCPEEIKVVTFGNTFICSVLTPSITAIKQNFELIAKKLLEILIEKIESENNIDKSFEIAAELIIRESTINENRKDNIK